MASKYPKYVKETGNTLGYQRAVPTRLQHIAKKRLYTYPLGLSLSASDAQIHRALADADEAFRLFCKTVEFSSPSSYSENEIDRLAQELLRRRGLEQGQFADVLDSELAQTEEELQQQLQAHSYNYADSVIPEFDDVVDTIQRDNHRQPTIKEATVIRAYQAVQTRKKIKPKTLSLIWNAYVISRGIDVTTRAGQKVNNRWLHLMSFIKDTEISPTTPDHIEAGIDEFVEAELARGLTSVSIKRTIAEPLACFRWANKRYRLKWRNIELPPLPHHKASERKPLPHDDQKRLVALCKSSNDWVAAAMLVMLQGGCMPSEVARLRLDEDINLQAQIPHVIISGGNEGLTKQEARKRIVPIVLGIDVISANLAEAIERLSAAKDPSATISKRLRTHISSHYSSHCLRHSFRLNGISANINPQFLQAIGGWSGGNVNKVMLNYGASGTGYSEVLRQLQKESLKIHEHLL